MNWLSRLFTPRKSPLPAAKRSRPTLEVLEDRSLLATSPLGLGAAGQFAVLGINGGDVDLNTASITGNLGLGPQETSTLRRSTVTGQFTYDPTSTPDLSKLNKNFFVSGGVVEQDLSQAAADANAASSADAALTPTQTLGNLNSSVTLTGNGGTNVIKLRSLNYGNGDVLTLQGGANDVFIINVAGNFAIHHGQIQLAGGVTAGHVLFNFPTTGSLIDLSRSDSVLNGTFLAPQRGVDFQDQAPFNGAIIAQDIFVHGNAAVNFAGFSLPSAALSSLSGFVLDEKAAAGLSGVTVTLTTTNSLGQTVVVATTMTDANGAFSFPSLAAGNYTITETLPGGYIDDVNQIGTAGGTTSDSQFNVALGAGVDGTGYTFGDLFVFA
jgi:hypothetical protein